MRSPFFSGSRCCAFEPYAEAPIATDVMRTFEPPEARLSDAALLERADRVHRLIRHIEWVIELREANEERAQNQLVDAVAEFVCRFLHPHPPTKGRPLAQRSNVSVALAAQRLETARDDARRATERARGRLARVRDAWTSIAVELARRFLKAPLTAVDLSGPRRDFRLWLNEEGEPVLTVALGEAI